MRRLTLRKRQDRKPRVLPVFLPFSCSLFSHMRKLCPNFDREDGLETVLEVPIPEEMFSSSSGHSNGRSWQSMKAWMRSQLEKSAAPQLSMSGGCNTELQLMLGVIGAPLTPLPICNIYSLNHDIKNQPIEASMAKYIVQQYIAATGGEKLLNSIDSMYAMGKVTMGRSEFQASTEHISNRKSKGGKIRRWQDEGEVGSFVLWQKRPELWCLELVVSGCKISAGSDGKVAWRQTPWHQSHASRGPPRPLRRLLQGLDPKSTAGLFSSSTCIGEKTINGEDCFLLKLEAEPSTLRARSGSNVEILRHTVWGYFSQRTGLLVQFEDSHLLRIMASGGSSIYWETTMSSSIQDYKAVDGVNIAHSGKTVVSLFRFGDDSESHNKTCMEETWTIEEVDFNIWGLSMDCFLPPGDLKKEQDECELAEVKRKQNNISLLLQPPLMKIGPTKISSSKVAAVNMEDSDSIEDEEEESSKC